MMTHDAEVFGSRYHEISDCPFCTAPARIEQRMSGLWYARCLGDVCDLTMGGFSSLSSAKEAWERRSKWIKHQ